MGPTAAIAGHLKNPTYSQRPQRTIKTNQIPVVDELHADVAHVLRRYLLDTMRQLVRRYPAVVAQHLPADILAHRRTSVQLQQSVGDQLRLRSGDLKQAENSKRFF